MSLGPSGGVAAWVMDAPTTIDGHEVIVVADVLEPDLCADPIPLTPLDGAPRTWAPERAIRAARETYPTIPVFGLWQLLGRQVAQSFSEGGPAWGLWIVWTDPDGGHGYYLQAVADAAWVSGQIAGHRPVGFSGVDLSDGRVADSAFLVWSDDFRPALLPEESAAAKRALPRRAMRNHVVGLLALAIGVIAAWGWDQTRASRLLTQTAQVTAEIALLRREQADLDASREQPLPPGFDDDLREHIATVQVLDWLTAGVSAPLEVPLLRLNQPNGRAVFQRSPDLSDWRRVFDDWQSRFGWRVSSEAGGQTVVTWGGLLPGRAQ